MGLNPGENKKTEELRQKVLDDSFNSGSPYFHMYWCGYYGVPIEECLAKCNSNGIPIRKKDIQSWKDGAFKRGMGIVLSSNSKNVRIENTISFNDMKLSDFPMFPKGWHGTERRFFPCTADNKPMQKWGWSRDFSPELYLACDAKALSPCGWVGQNMLYQQFIVFDIDGRGHGEEDLEVIEFGNQFKDMTFTMEDPAKPGSFHLYFETDRLIPVRHFPWGKLDLMGNAVNAAVYLKNKKPNGLPMMKLDESIWQNMMSYQKRRKEQLCL